MLPTYGMLSSAPIIAFWPFASGWLLLWGLAAAMPVIIHLWSRRRYREITWAAMEFLLAAAKRNSRRIQLEQLLLLVIRVLILLLFAVALAEPLWQWGVSRLGAGGGRTHHILVIDASYSMELKQDGKSLFETARLAAVQLVEQSTRGDGFSLVLLADPPQVIIAQPTFDVRVVMDELNSLSATDGGAKLSATLAEVETLLAATEKSYPRLTQRHVALFSDLGKTTWDEVVEPPCRAQITRLAERANLTLTNLEQKEPSNLAVTRMVTVDPLPTVGRDVLIEAEIANFGSANVTGKKISLLMDGELVAEKTVDVVADGRTAVSFTTRFETAGNHGLQVALAADVLPVDDRRWLAVSARESIRVLCVEGQPEEAKYLAFALEPTRSDRPRVRAEVVNETAILETDLLQYDAVFLCNVGRFQQDEAGVLVKYLQNGGGLVIFLGDQVQAESYNEQLGGGAGLPRILPASIKQAVSGAEYRFDPLQYRHTLVAPFRDQVRAGLLTTPVWKFFRLQPLDAENTHVALAFNTGEPAIIEERVSRGRCILFATAASTVSLNRDVDPPVPWTALPTWPSFVPLVQEMLNLALRDRAANRDLLVGDLLHGEGERAVGGEVTVAGPALPDGTFPSGERVALSHDSSAAPWTFAETQRSGLYRVSSGTSNDSSTLFSINIDPVESNLARLETDALPSELRSGSQIKTDTTTPSMLGGGQRSLFRYFLSAVFVLLLLESTVAWWFGNRSR